MASGSGHKQLTAQQILPAEAAGLLAAFSGREPVVLAVSGGPDSMALMALMADLSAVGDVGPSSIKVLSVDHGLRPGSKQEALEVGVQARRFGFDHTVLTWRGAKPARGVQAAARTARYDLMSAWCVENGIGNLLLAHTLNDLAETFLLRLARGSGVDGLAAMADGTLWNGVALRRPLLDVPRDRLIETLRARAIAYVCDPSNSDDRFARARMRKLMPALAAEGLTVNRLAGTARRMLRARLALEQAAMELSRRVVTLFDAGHCQLDAAALADAPGELTLRVLARTVMALGGNHYPPRLSGLERLGDWMVAGESAGCTLGGCRFERRGTVVTAYRERGRHGAGALALKSGQSAVWDRRFHVHAPVGAGATYWVRALEAEGWRYLRDEAAAPPKLPARIGHGLVSFWQDDRLIAVPHVGFRACGQVENADFTAQFCNAALLGFSDGALAATDGAL